MENIKKAAFGAGCFWGVEELFRTKEGVAKTLVGYMGGETDAPTYEQVCSKKTGHAEVVYIEYNEKIVSYETLLNLFWENHNPTTMNRQGPDIGSQYRSVIFYYDENQKNIAEKSKTDLETSAKWQTPIVTQIVDEKGLPFYKAEEYHQQYLAKRGVGSCHI